ncbi:addiction module HigA family antidote [Dysgonomonadaceae bacterium PH5-43]|nr:addiction module HigA family antidote [Dysgonomonadaceae bacterium PH5-43]
MKQNLDTYKGIPPGKIIDRKLRNLGLSQRAFARAIGEHSQSINAVITGRRQLTTELSIKIERALEYEEGFLLALQAYYNVAAYKQKEASLSVTGIPNVRRILFWDTDFDKIDWGLYRKAIIQRVIERGSEDEKIEIFRFYGIDRSEEERFKSFNSYSIRTKIKQI